MLGIVLSECALSMRESTVVPSLTEFSGSVCNAAHAMQWTSRRSSLPRESGSWVVNEVRVSPVTTLRSMFPFSRSLFHLPFSVAFQEV